MKSSETKQEFVAAIFTKNEASNVSDCIESLAGVSKIVVIDSMSDDGTPNIARLKEARVLSFEWDGKYPRKKQWSLSKLKSADWVLMMDADLRATSKLIDEINQLIQYQEASAILIPIEYWFNGKRLKHGVKVKYFGVLRPKSAVFPDVEIEGEGYGDIEFHYQPQISGKILKTKNSMIHRDNDPISSWVERHNKYASYQAKINNNSKIKDLMDSNKTIQGKLFARAPFKSIFFFLFSYVLKGGFLDGVRGFQYNYLLAHHYYLQKIYQQEID